MSLQYEDLRIATTTTSEDESPEFITREFTLAPDIASSFGIPTSTDVHATSKTIHLRTRDITLEEGGSAATLSEGQVTVTKMFNPATSLPYLFIAFSYNVTSRGYRTGTGVGGEVPAGITQGLFFKDRDGGIIWSWGFPGQELTIHCGDDLHQSYHIVRSYDDVSWFDLWARVRWQFNDGFVWGC